MSRDDLEVLTQGAVHVYERDELAERLERGRPLRVKLGIDPTASDIHLGFAVVLRKLRQFQDRGHVAVLILGDLTARIGDPSMRSATRPMLSSDEIELHARSYVDQITKILDPSPARLEVRRNSEWLGSMGTIDVLGLAGRATVAQMLARDDFANRHRSGVAISVAELLYPLMQGWDSVMVQADVELGGTDQLFNLLVGRQLQEKDGQSRQVVLTMPLLVGLDGDKKMSKSLGNYVGIDEPPVEQFGKLMSIPDALLAMYVRHATGWDQSQIDQQLAGLGDGTIHPNAAKRAMAGAVVDLYSGRGAGAAAEAEFDRVHKHHDVPTEVVDAVVPLVGTVRVSRLLEMLGLTGSVREAARLVGQGGVRIDGERMDADRELDVGRLDGALVQVGRRKWARVRLEPEKTPPPS